MNKLKSIKINIQIYMQAFSYNKSVSGWCILISNKTDQWNIINKNKDRLLQRIYNNNHK